MAMLPKFFKDCVVAIGTIVKTTSGAENKMYIGTGFLVGYPTIVDGQDNKSYEIYLITNRHVINNRKDILVKFNGTSETKDYKINLINDKGQINYGLCKNKDIDIVAIRINPYKLINDSSTFAYFSLDYHALTVKQMQEQGITEGDFVYTLGFPLNLVGKQKSIPICRMGCISTISHITEYGIGDLNYFIDSQTFPGNSGGPVVIRPEPSSIEGTKTHNKAALIGILHSYIPYSDKCISVQTGEVVQLRQENSGLTLVHPVDLIIKAIENERARLKTLQESTQKTNNTVK